MKQILLKTWLILVCLLTGAGTMWAEVQTATFTMKNSGQSSPVKVNGVTFTWTSSNIVVGTNNGSGFKANSNMTITIPAGKKLTGIEKGNGNTWGSGAQIDVYAGTSSSGTKITTITKDTHTYIISSNNTGTTYYLANTSSKNAWLNTLTIKYDDNAGGGSTPTALSVPTNLSSSNVTTTGATLSWDAVDNASSYTVKIGETEYTGVNTNSYSATGLTAGTQYTWTVKAVGDGTNYSSSDYAANANFTTTAAASHKAYFYVNGTLQNEGGTSFAEGASITFPSDPADINNTKFQGWTKTQNYSNSTDAPSDMTKSATMGNADVNYYAVFATVNGNGGTATGTGLSATTSAQVLETGKPITYKSSAANTYSDPVRIYKNGTFTIAGATMTQIVLEGDDSSNPATNLVLKSGEPGSISTGTNSVTWTGPATSVTFVASSAQARVKTITVKYGDVSYSDYCTTVGPSKQTPTLSFENPTYNATMGEDFTAPTLTNEQNVTVTYSSSVEGVATVNASTGAIELVAPGTTKITASFAGNETYNANSASYTLEVAAAPAPALTTMDEIFAAATTAGSTATEVRVTFNNWVVSGVKNSNAYVTDNAGKGFIVYTSGHGFEVGDILSGTAACKVQLYRGSAELTTLTSSSEGLTVTKGGVITPVTTIELASLSGVNTGAVLSYENLQFDGENFTDGVTNLTPYNTFIPLPNLVKDKNYNVTGIYVQYDETKEIAPRSEEDFELLNVLNKYIVNIETPTNGTLTIKNGETTVNSGDEVEEGTFLAIVCKEVSNDYRFVKWEYKAGEEDWKEQYESPGTLIMPSADVQLRATFELIPTFTVAWSVNGNIVKSETLQVGTEITAPKVDDIYGKKFTGWVVTATVASDETPEYVYPEKVLDNVTYYAVFATLNGAGGGSSVHELTQEQIASAYVGSGDNKTTSYGSYEFGSGWSGNCLINKYNNVCFVQIRKNVANNYVLTPDFGEGVKSITINTTASGSTMSTPAKRTFYLCANNKEAQPSSGAYGSGAVSEDNGSVTIEVTGAPHQFYIYANGGAYIKSISVTYGEGATYSNYCTIVSAPLPEGGIIKFVGTTGDGKYYATFSSTRAIKFDEAFINDAETCMASVKAYAITVVDDQLYRTDQYNVNNYGTGYTFIPANTAVLFEYILDEESEIFDGAVPFEYADAEAEYLSPVEDNMLVACPETGACPSVEGTNFYYKLAYGDNNSKTKLGFWWGANDGSNNFNVKAGGAVLVVPQSVGSNLRGFRFDDDPGRPTGIESLSNDVVAGEIYNLQGQRINRLQQGVNIVNGRKVIR